MAKYYCNTCDDVISEIMIKKNWVKAVNQESDIKFSYSNKIQGDLMLTSDDEIKWLEKCVISKNYHNFLGPEYVIELNNNQEVITELITNIKSNRTEHIPCDELFKDIEDESIVILGCTELPLVKAKFEKYCLENKKNITFIDCNLIYAEQIFNEYNN